MDINTFTHTRTHAHTHSPAWNKETRVKMKALSLIKNRLGWRSRGQRSIIRVDGLLTCTHACTTLAQMHSLAPHADVHVFIPAGNPVYTQTHTHTGRKAPLPEPEPIKTKLPPKMKEPSSKLSPKKDEFGFGFVFIVRV